MTLVGVMAFFILPLARVDGVLVETRVRVFLRVAKRRLDAFFLSEKRQTRTRVSTGRPKFWPPADGCNSTAWKPRNAAIILRARPNGADKETIMTIFRRSLWVALGATAVAFSAGPMAQAQTAAPIVPPDATPLSKYAYPLAPAIAPPKVTIDTTDFPQGEAWAKQAQLVVEQWFPAVWQMLGTQGQTPPETVRLVFVKQQAAPAQAGGGQISVSGPWITAHPDDLGMMVHELTHLIQRYPNFPGKPGWLVEGIADYTRWWRYEPETPRPKIDPLKNNYTDSYRVTAAFLAFLANKYDKAIVPKLDKTLRDKTYTDAVFVEITGKDLPTLWSEFAPKPAV